MPDVVHANIDKEFERCGIALTDADGRVLKPSEAGIPAVALKAAADLAEEFSRMISFGEPRLTAIAARHFNAPMRRPGVGHVSGSLSRKGDLERQGIIDGVYIQYDVPEGNNYAGHRLRIVFQHQSKDACQYAVEWGHVEGGKKKNFIVEKNCVMIIPAQKAGGRTRRTS